MNKDTPAPARNTKVMNRFDLTKRLVARLKHEEAVIGGIGNTNFDLWSAGHRPQNFYMLGSMGLRVSDRARRRAGAAAAARHRAGGRRFAADAARLPFHHFLAGAEKSQPDRDGQRHLSDHRRTADAGRGNVRHRCHRARLRSGEQRVAADEEDFERLVDRSLAATAPTLIALRIDDKPGVGTTDRDPVQIRERFMRGVGVRKEVNTG